MDARRFDQLAKGLATSASRRAALAALIVVAAPVDGVAKRANRHREPDGPSAEACVPDGQRCGKGSGKKRTPCRKCCSRYAIRQRNGQRRCSCKPDGARAGNPAQCCTGSRDATGFCGACPTGQSRCRPGCVDFRTDSHNCDGCGVRCGAGEVCRDRACVPCGGAGQPCCADDACARGRVCQPDGTCSLPPGTCDAGQDLCDQQATTCNGDSICRCATSVAGEVFCRGVAVCGVDRCGGDDDCPDGQACVEFCDGGSPITCCASPCRS